MIVEEIKGVSPEVISAIELAARRHYGQLYSPGEPYLAHCLRVGLSLLSETNLAVAGILHDILEDTEVTRIELHNTFGEEITSLIVALTRLHSETYQEYIERVSWDKRVAIIKIADLSDNLGRALSDPRHTSKVKRYAKALETLVKIHGFPVELTCMDKHVDYPPTHARPVYIVMARCKILGKHAAAKTRVSESIYNDFDDPQVQAVLQKSSKETFTGMILDLLEKIRNGEVRSWKNALE